VELHGKVLAGCWWSQVVPAVDACNRNVDDVPVACVGSRVDDILAPPMARVLDLDQLPGTRIDLRFRHVFPPLPKHEVHPMRSLMLLLALALPAAAHDHDHAHDHAHQAGTAATATAAVQRWNTDAPLREGMGRIRHAVDALQHYEHGHIGPEQAVQLAAGIERDVGFIVAHCKLEPRADAALHPILGALMHGAQALKAKPTELAAIPPMRSALHDYARQFDDPGVSAREPEESR
jgi:hypothetical protein